MAILIAGTPNKFFLKEDKLCFSTIVNSCKLIIATQNEYSVYNIITHKRVLHKKFKTDDPKLKFNTQSEFDVFRIIAKNCLQIADKVLKSNFDAIKDFEDIICFVKKPQLPKIIQMVGFGCNYDFELNGKRYKYIQKPLDYAYNIYYDLSSLYYLDEDKVSALIVLPKLKTFLKPGTVKIKDNFIYGVDFISNNEVEILPSDCWVIPKPQFVSIEELFSFVKQF